jgi:ABC-type Na+ transport system ATPase subunit NatA
MQEVESICDRIVVINNGKLLQIEILKTLKKQKQKDKLVLVEFEKK